MIKALFTKDANGYNSFSIKGHAMYDDFGKDIVCASVTSAVQLTANAITEVIGIKAVISVLENEIKLKLPENSPKEAYDFMHALFIHIGILSEDYWGAIELKVLEVQH